MPTRTFIPPFNKIRSDNADLMAIQDNIEQWIRAVLNVPYLDGRLIENVTISGAGSSVAIDVEHGLGRKYRGFFQTKQTTSGALANTLCSIETANDDFYIRLFQLVSTTSVYDIWIF